MSDSIGFGASAMSAVRCAFDEFETQLIVEAVETELRLCAAELAEMRHIDRQPSPRAAEKRDRLCALHEIARKLAAP